MSPATSVPGPSSTGRTLTGSTDSTRTSHHPATSSRQLPPLRAVLGPQLDLPTPHEWNYDPGDMWRVSPSSASDPSPSVGPDNPSSNATHYTPRSPSHFAPPITPTNFSARDADADTVVSPPSLTSLRSRSGFLALSPRPAPHTSPHPQTPRSAPPLTSPAQPALPSPSFDRIIRSTVPQPPYSAPPYSAQHVLRPSPSGELITGPSIPRRSRTAAAAAPFGASSSVPSPASIAELRAQWEKRHVCDICQKRFNRPSSLKTHQTVHTGSRPHACSYPGCTKTFSVVSNMRRHLRKHAHESGSAHGPGHTHASEPAPEYTHEHDQDELEHSQTHEQDSFGSSEASGSGSGEGEMDVDQLTEEESYVTNAAVTSAGLPALFPSVFSRSSQADYEWTVPVVGSSTGSGRRCTTPARGRGGPHRASGSPHDARTS